MSSVVQENPTADDSTADPSGFRASPSALVVLTTTETPQQAEQLAQLLVAREVAACVQILPPMTSIYRWQDAVERATETLLLIKTTRDMYLELESTIRSNHPYQTPEIIALPIAIGSADYLQWLASSLKK